jgi:hypothetical protein
VSFLTAIAVAVIIFAVQILLFLLLRNKLARILYVLLRLQETSLSDLPLANQKPTWFLNVSEPNPRPRPLSASSALFSVLVTES